MVIDIPGPQALPCELLQEVVLFVSGVIGSDDADFPAALAHRTDRFGNGFERLGPGNRIETAGRVSQHGRLQALRMIHEVERVAALDAQEFAVDSAMVAVVAAHDLVIADAERCPAAIAAMRANRPDVLHLPGPRLVAVDAARQGADGADVDAGAALVAFQIVMPIRNNLGDDAAVCDAERADAHAFIAYAHATVTQDASRSVEKYHRRPLLFIHMLLALGEAALARAVAEHHVLELALAALVAHGTIQRMIRQQELERSLSRLANRIRFGVD